jgi:hypothetical protein
VEKIEKEVMKKGPKLGQRNLANCGLMDATVDHNTPKREGT